MRLGDIKLVLEGEGIQTVIEEDALKELVFPDEDYHEIEHVMDGWKLNYVKKDKKHHISYICIKKLKTEDEISLLYIVVELEKYYTKLFYHSFYKNQTQTILGDNPDESGLRVAMEMNAIPFRYVSLMGLEPYMVHSILLYLKGEEWAVSYINYSGKIIEECKTYVDYVDAMTGLLECAFKLYLYDLFAEKQRAKGLEMRLLNDMENAFLLGFIN